MADSSTGISSENSNKLSNIDVTKLTPLSPEVISKQATINIGTIGHVAHGKSTVVKALSGVQTVRFKNELERNITIKLGEEKRGEEVIDSTMVGPEEDEDLQVLAEIQSTVASLKKTAVKSEAKDYDSDNAKYLHSPSRPSVIQHSKTSPAKRNLAKELDDSTASSTMDDLPLDSDKAKTNRKPGPKSKTQHRDLDSMSEDENQLKDADSKPKRKPGPKSKTQVNHDDEKRKPGPKSRTSYLMHNGDASDDDSESEVSKKPGPKSKMTAQNQKEAGSDVETKKKPGPKSKTITQYFKVVQKSDSESDAELVKKPGPKSKTSPKVQQDEDAVEFKKKPGPKSRTSLEASTSKVEKKMEVDSDSDSSKAKKQDSDSDDSMKNFEIPKPYSTRKSMSKTEVSNQLAQKPGRVLRQKTDRKKYPHYSSDEEVAPAPKKQRTISNESEDRSDVKKKKYTKKDNSYRSKKRRKSSVNTFTKVDRKSPSETRVIEEGNAVDMSVGRQDDGEYEVETVTESRKSEGRLYYKIKWKGWPALYNTWEPMEFLVHSQESLLEFFQNEPERSEARIVALSKELPALGDVSGKFLEYETNTVSDLKQEDFKEIDLTFPEGFDAVLPSDKLLCSHINKVLKVGGDVLKKKIRHLIAVREAVRLRFEQLKLLKEWQEDMNVKSEKEALLLVENNVDLEGPPLNFNFRSVNVQGEGVEIPDDPFVGCQCDHCDEGEKCCGAMSGSKLAYTSDGLLKVEHGTPVYECNKRCKCDNDCTNRVVQKGRSTPLCIFRTPNNIGWGVKVLEDVPQGKFVCEYVGEVVKREVADERLKNEYKGRPLYIFDLDFNDSKEFPYTVDAYQYGNVSHFINHSCEPNLAVYAVWIDCLDPNLPRLAMFAIRDIKKGEELTFDYSAQYHRKRKSQSGKKEPRKRAGKTPCMCGSGMCRGVTF